MVSNFDNEEILRRVEEIRGQVAAIQGWLHDCEGANLYQLARFHAPTPTVVELGSWKGRSTAWLAAALRDRGEGRVYAVDTWAGSHREEVHQDLLKAYAPGQLLEEFQQNMDRLGFKELIEVVSSDTVQASKGWPVDREIGLLFIDAAHDYESVRRDFEFWSPHVTNRGLIVFDDVPSWPGPTRLVSELPRYYIHFHKGANQLSVQKVLR